MQDWFSPDPLGALEQGFAANSAVQSFWQETLDNLTSGRAGACQIQLSLVVHHIIRCKVCCGSQSLAPQTLNSTCGSKSLCF